MKTDLKLVFSIVILISLQLFVSCKSRQAAKVQLKGAEISNGPIEADKAVMCGIGIERKECVNVIVNGPRQARPGLPSAFEFAFDFSQIGLNRWDGSCDMVALDQSKNFLYAKYFPQQNFTPAKVDTVFSDRDNSLYDTVKVIRSIEFPTVVSRSVAYLKFECQFRGMAKGFTIRVGYKYAITYAVGINANNTGLPTIEDLGIDNDPPKIISKEVTSSETGIRFGALVEDASSALWVTANRVGLQPCKKTPSIKQFSCNFTFPKNTTTVNVRDEAGKETAVDVRSSLPTIP